ncbi:decarboxylase [Candidatus Woesearchaeota archaeon]|nr:MAG: decarboxylase [Candidatus Woesearchaeota archaeon ex4484_78]RLE47100.1 MAG: decarboxylase [Candidatus Woesearchaeota archaeon]
MSKARFLLSKGVVLKKFSEISSLADVVSYSLKTNFEVGKVLEKETDCFFSVHSLNSLKRLSDFSRVWFFLQGNSVGEIEELFGLGVCSFVVDNVNDLNSILGFAEKNNKRINLLLRLRVKEHSIHTGRFFVFGFYSKDINRLLPELSANSCVLKLGVHFHRKTQNVSEWFLKDELEYAVLPENFRFIDFVNIGGGFPSVYKNFKAEVFDDVFFRVKELRHWLNEKNVKLIVEPGRFIAAPAVKLEAEIINVYDNNVIVNCSVFNAFMDVFIANIRLLVEGELDKGTPFTVKGCTPDSLDIFRYSVFLDDPKIGDKIIFLNAGAYNFHSDFCGLDRIETVVVE